MWLVINKKQHLTKLLPNLLTLITLSSNTGLSVLHSAEHKPEIHITEPGGHLMRPQTENNTTNLLFYVSTLCHLREWQRVCFVCAHQWRRRAAAVCPGTGPGTAWWSQASKALGCHNTGWLQSRCWLQMSGRRKRRKRKRRRKRIITICTAFSI